MLYNTKILSDDDKNIDLAVRALKDGEVVAMPTETVYGLAANAFDVPAIRKIFKAKGRPQDNPLIVHISDIDMLKNLTTEISSTAKKIIGRFWPGPLTVIFPKSESVPLSVTAGLNTVAVRFPSHPVANKLIKSCGFPLAAPSANISGKPSPTTAYHVFDDMDGKIPYIIDGGACEVGLESTVIALNGNDVCILRPGEITKEDLMEVTPMVFIDKAVTSELKSDKQAASPGMKYKHYSPRASVTLIDADINSFKNYCDDNADSKTYFLVYEEELSFFPAHRTLSLGSKNNYSQQARNLFAKLREIDKSDAEKIFARCPDKKGIGLAVYNRMIRAAGFKIIEL